MSITQVKKPLGLLAKELEVGNVYRCRLSDRPVLIITSEERESETRASAANIKYWHAEGQAYNPINGLYESIYPYDYQLEVIPVGKITVTHE